MELPLATYIVMAALLVYVIFIIIIEISNRRRK